MRKLLDWIADKLGYERKLEITAWPLKLTTPKFMPPFPLTETQNSEDWPPSVQIIEPFDDGFSVPFRSQNLKVTFRFYEDDHGSPGKEISDDLFVVKE